MLQASSVKSQQISVPRSTFNVQCVLACGGNRLGLPITFVVMEMAPLASQDRQ